MKAFCITISEDEKSTEDAAAHFNEIGLKVDFVDGINGELSSLITTNTYDIDQPGWMIPKKHVGLVLSHYLVWSICSRDSDDIFMILESDAEFESGWRDRMLKALDDTPKDFDILMIGSCCCSDKPKSHIAGDVWEVKWPFCTHAMILTKNAVNFLLKNERRCWAKIDLALAYGSYRKMKVYTVLPSIVRQRGRSLIE